MKKKFLFQFLLFCVLFCHVINGENMRTYNFKNRFITALPFSQNSHLKSSSYLSALPISVDKNWEITPCQIHDSPNNNMDIDSLNISSKDNIALEQYENPLTGLQSFSMLLVYFSEDKGTMDKINKIMMEELGTIGTIKIIKCEKESLQNTFWEGYNGQAFFEFKSQDLMSNENKKIPVIRYTLNIYTSAIINKTKTKSVVDAWRKDCYVKNESKYDLSNKTIEAYRSLIREFKENYLFYNPEKKPIFYLFAGNVSN